MKSLDFRGGFGGQGRSEGGFPSGIVPGGGGTAWHCVGEQQNLSISSLLRLPLCSHEHPAVEIPGNPKNCWKKTPKTAGGEPQISLEPLQDIIIISSSIPT